MRYAGGVEETGVGAVAADKMHTFTVGMCMDKTARGISNTFSFSSLLDKGANTCSRSSDVRVDILVYLSESLRTLKSRQCCFWIDTSDCIA